MGATLARHAMYESAFRENCLSKILPRCLYKCGKQVVAALMLRNLSQKVLSGRGGACSTYVGRGEVYTGFWWGNLKERDHLGDPDIDERIILSWIFRKWDVGVWTGSSWVRIGTDDRHL